MLLIPSANSADVGFKTVNILLLIVHSPLSYTSCLKVIVLSSFTNKPTMSCVIQKLDCLNNSLLYSHLGTLQHYENLKNQILLFYVLSAVFNSTCHRQSSKTWFSSFQRLYRVHNIGCIWYIGYIGYIRYIWNHNPLIKI